MLTFAASHGEAGVLEKVASVFFVSRDMKFSLDRGGRWRDSPHVIAVDDE